MGDLRAYLGSDSFKDDQENGRGINIYGPASTRSDALMLVAKMFVFSASSTYFTTVNQCLSALEGNGEFRSTLDRIDNLFIDFFERDFKAADGRPYSFYQLVQIEDFLIRRFQSGRVTMFGSHCAWMAQKWYSRDFLSTLEANVIDIQVGK